VASVFALGPLRIIEGFVHVVEMGQ